MKLTKEQKLDIYKGYLDEFKNQKVLNIVEKIIENTPTIFFGASTSSTGKYHPVVTNGFMGLVKHSLAVMITAKEFMRNETIMKVFNLENLSDLDKEIILAACLVHDNAKYGADELDYTQFHYTRTEHPRLVVDIVKKAGLENFDKEDKEILNKMLHLIETHMGEWTKVRGGEDLKKPSSKIQAFVHLCDYTVSKKTFDIVSELSVPESFPQDIIDGFKNSN